VVKITLFGLLYFAMIKPRHKKMSHGVRHLTFIVRLAG
jgi:hypothetical protein